MLDCFISATKKSDIPHRSVVPALPGMPSAPDSQLPAGANGQTADQAQALAPDMAAYPQADQAQGLPADQQFTPQAAGPSDMLAPGTGMQADSQSAMSQLDAAAPAPSIDPNAQAPVPGADPNAQAPAAGVDPYAQAPVPGADPNAQSPYMSKTMVSLSLFSQWLSLVLVFPIVLFSPVLSPVALGSLFLATTPFQPPVLYFLQHPISFEV